MPVLLRSHLRSSRLRSHKIRQLAHSILFQMGEVSSELGVMFVGDRHMRRLNKQFRNKDHTTDVLAFPMRGARPHCVPGRRELLGDVVISVPTAERQARHARHSLSEELIALLIHGILHLCGYDHERNDAEARRMRRREHKVRSRLGSLPSLSRSEKKV